MPRLTEQEQQEIIRFIETGKPLPDKYRFLLFDDKREVELVWNGKTNEVCNIVLPFQVIEQVDEPRTENPEKQKLQTDLFSMDTRGRQLKGWTNKLIWGDNKLILSSLKNGPLQTVFDAGARQGQAMPIGEQRRVFAGSDFRQPRGQHDDRGLPQGNASLFAPLAVNMNAGTRSEVGRCLMAFGYREAGE